MKKSIITLITLAVLLTFTSILFAQNHENCEMNKPGMKKEMSQDKNQGCSDKMEKKDELKLSDKQKDDLEKLQMANRKEVIIIEAEIDTKQIDMRQAMENADYAKAKAINKDIFEKRALVSQKRIELVENMMKIYTPEQKEMIKKNPRLMMGHGMGQQGCMGEGKEMPKRHPGMKMDKQR